MTLCFGSLFSGVGGLCLGLERAGLRCAFQVELDPWCRSVLDRHWPKVMRFADARLFPDGPVPAVDVLAGGDPCQQNSRARMGANTSSPSLGAEFLRIIDALSPRYVIRENPTHARADAPWPWGRFASALVERGYAVRGVRVRACCFGYPHRRDRLFVLGRKGARPHPDREPFRLPGRGETALTQEAVQAEARKWQWLRSDAGAVGRGERGGYHPGVGGGDDGLPAALDRTRRLKALGNSVCPPVAEFIGRLVVEEERCCTAESPARSSAP